MRRFNLAIMLIGMGLLAWLLWPQASQVGAPTNAPVVAPTDTLIKPPTQTPPKSHPSKRVPAPLPAPRATTGAYGDIIGIPVLMFHRFEAQPKNKFSIAPDEFRRVLMALKHANYCLVGLKDYLENRFDATCEGRKLFALTFDDGHSTQLKLLPDAQVDPNSGLGVLLSVFPQAKATFFLNVSNAGRPFGPASDQKVRRLRELGLEIGNHTVSHPYLNRLPDTRVAQEVSNTCRYFGMNRMNLAYPYGVAPRKPITSYQTGCTINAAFGARLGYFEGIPRGQGTQTGPFLAPLPASAAFKAMRYRLPRLNIHSLADLRRDVLENPGVYRLPAGIKPETSDLRNQLTR
jgi:hypothetical protein